MVYQNIEKSLDKGKQTFLLNSCNRGNITPDCINENKAPMIILKCCSNTNDEIGSLSGFFNFPGFSSGSLSREICANRSRKFNRYKSWYFNIDSSLIINLAGAGIFISIFICRSRDFSESSSKLTRKLSRSQWRVHDSSASEILMWKLARSIKKSSGFK